MHDGDGMGVQGGALLPEPAQREKMAELGASRAISRRKLAPPCHVANHGQVAYAPFEQTTMTSPSYWERPV